MLDSVDCVVVGAGVVGLVVARALALQGRQVLVLEAENAIGTGISSRNSEVIHAGIYYPTGSLKARLCVQGQRMLYAYCAERGLPHQRCGKLVVATSAAQQAQLKAIAERGAANGAGDLQWLTRSAARQREPALECVAALYSPSTGIVIARGSGTCRRHGGLPYATAACAMRAGWHCFNHARRSPFEGVDGCQRRGFGRPAPGAAICRTGSAPCAAGFLCQGQLFFPQGQSTFFAPHLPGARNRWPGCASDTGPGWPGQIQWVTDPADLDVQVQRSAVFYDEVRKYWPQLPDDALVPAYAGMRPKIHGPTESAADFCIQAATTHGVRGLINLFGIESPGLTSALALGEHVAHLAAACRTSARRVA